MSSYGGIVYRNRIRVGEQEIWLYIRAFDEDLQYEVWRDEHVPFLPAYTVYVGNDPAQADLWWERSLNGAMEATIRENRSAIVAESRSIDEEVQKCQI